jgi:hypothetical protein
MRAAWLLLPLLIASCYQPKEGCLDITATNYNALADVSCCCVYPTLRLSIQHRMDTSIWQRDSAYQTLDGQWFRLRDAAFYLSDFAFLQGGTAYRVTDVQTFRVFGDNTGDTARIDLTDDMTLIRRSSVDVPIGTLRASGTFDRFTFRAGLYDEANRVVPTLAPANHPLRLQPEVLWAGPQDGYHALYLVLNRDTLPGAAPDTFRIRSADIPDATVPTDGTFFLETGFNAVIRLRVNYTRLFLGVDLSNPDISAVQRGIAANFPFAIAVLP